MLLFFFCYDQNKMSTILAFFVGNAERVSYSKPIVFHQYLSKKVLGGISCLWSAVTAVENSYGFQSLFIRTSGNILW